MNYTEWLKEVPVSLTGDALWKVEAYRLALFAADISWRDATKLMADRRTIGLANQLYSAVGSIGANLSEGYSRGSAKDRARFYEYSLGSARESRTWYFDGRQVLGEPVAQHRMEFLTQIIRLLLTMIPDQRAAALHDDTENYTVSSHGLSSGFTPALLTEVPMP